MACRCQCCWSYYKIDLIVEDELWEKIKPPGESKRGGLLCPLCIIVATVRVMEEEIGYAALELQGYSGNLNRTKNEQRSFPLYRR